MRARAGSQPVRARADAGVDSGAEEEEGATEPNAGLGDGDGGAFWEGLGGRAGLAPSFSGVPPARPGVQPAQGARPGPGIPFCCCALGFQRVLAFNVRKACPVSPAKCAGLKRHLRVF